MDKIIKVISNQKVIIVLFFLFALFASLQSLTGKEKTFVEGGDKYTHYNNYIIFKQSFVHLTENKDLYQLYPKEHWDYYKYSPTFSMFFGMFAIFPNALGLSLWNIINAFVFLLAIYYLPKINKTQKGFILLACLVELMTSMQNSQSNALMAGLIILSFGFLEKDKYLLATLCIVFSVFIKLFGVVGMILFLFYPKKWKLALFSVLWALALFSLPLLIVNFEHLKFLYLSWGHLLANDQSSSYGLSVMGWLHSWFNLDVNKQITILIGALIFLLPLIRFNQYKNFQYKLLYLSSVLLWIIIFNLKAESPTFIIAMAGVSVFFFTNEKNLLNKILFISAFVFTSLSPTDIFPQFIRFHFFEPYVIKAFPCILIWIKIVYDQIKFNLKNPHSLQEV